MVNLQKRCFRLFSIVLIALMIATNPAFILSIHAAASDNDKEQTTLTLDKSSEDMPKDSEEKLAEDSSQVTNNQKATQFANRLISYYLNDGKKQGPAWLKTTDFSLQFTDDHKPIFSLETIQPFSQVNEGQLWFWQGRYAYQSDNATGNVGVGWRKLSQDKSQMFGLNMFYDYGFQYHLSRIGLGTEYFNKLIEYRANYYMPLSGDKQTSVTELPNATQYTYIRAVEGFDYEIGSSLANARWLSFYASGFYYNNKYSDDEKGYRLRSKMQITPRFSLDLGYEHSNLNSGSFYGKFMYQMANSFAPALGNKEHKDMDLSYKLLQKVERNNTIKTETYTKTIAYTGGIRVHVTNNGTNLAAAQVQAYDQNNSPVGSSITSDGNGYAIISGLSTGLYTVRAIYTPTGDSNSTTAVVTKDAIVDAPIPLTISGLSSASVTVLDANSAAISGASVTATLVSNTVAKADKTIIDRIFGVRAAYAAATSFSVTIQSNASGVAEFHNLTPGTYKFTVTYNNITMNSPTVSIKANSTGAATVIVPSASNVGNISITVKDKVTNAVVSGAEVKVLSSTGVVKGTKNTGSDGSAIFSGLDEGSYTLSVTKNGYDRSTASIAVVSGETTSSTVSLVPQTGSVSVTLSGMMATSDYTVTVTDSAGGTHTGTVKKSSTVATIGNVPAGNCTVAVTSPSGYTASVSPANFTLSAGGSQAVSVVSASQGSGSVNATLSGTMATADYTVTVTDSAGGTHTGTVKSGSTAATISSVPAGSCTVAVTAPSGYTASVTPASFTLAASGSQAVSVVSSSQGNGSVNVTLSGAMAAANYAITVTDSAGGTHTGTVNKTGTTASISNIPAGSCTVAVTAPSGYTTAITPASFTLAVSGRQDVSVVSANQGSGSVNVTLSGTMAIGNYTVTVTDSAGGTHQQTVNKNTTTAAIADIPAGNCTVAVTAPNGYTATITNPASGSFTMAASGSQAVAISSASQGNGSVAVNLTGVKATADYTVAVTDSGGAVHQGTVNGTSGHTTTTISSVPAGNCTVTVTPASGYSATIDTSSFTLAASGSQTVTVTSASLGTGSITVDLIGTMSSSDYTVTVTDSTGGTSHQGTINSTTSGQAMTISGVPAGACSIAVTAPTGFNATINPSTFNLAAGGSQTVTVNSSSGTAVVTINLTSAGLMAVNDYTVTVTDHDNVAHQATVNKATQTATVAVPLGACTATVTHPNGYTATLNLSSFTLTSAGQTLNVATDSTGTTNVIVNLAGTASTSNYVVVVTDSAGGTHQASINKNTGGSSITLTGIPLGDSHVAVTPPNGYTATVDTPAFTLTTAKTLTLTSTSKGTGTITLNLAGTASTSDYTVTVTDSTGGTTHQGTINKNTPGQTMTISGVPLGDCTIAVINPSGYTTAIDTSSFALTGAGKTVTITSTSSGTGTITVNLAGAASTSDYTVVVTDSTGGTTHQATINKNTSGISITGVPLGNCTVTVTPPNGYTANFDTSTFVLTSSNKTLTLTSVSAGNSSVIVNLGGTLVSTSDYTVTVTDSSGATHQGTINKNTAGQSITISTIPQGNSTITVSAPTGYSATISPSSFTLGASATTVAVTSSSVGNSSVTVALSGTVSTGDYTVTVTDSSGATHQGPINSNTGTIPSIPQGPCTVTVSAPTGYSATISPASFTLGASASALTITSSIQTFTISSTVNGGTGGKITPPTGGDITTTGTTTVNYNSTPAFTITADSTHKISGIYIDGSSTSENITATGAGGSQTYQFSSVTGSHTISATFAAAAYGTADIIVKDGNGTPVSGATVTVKDVTTLFGITNSNGEVIIPNIPAGSHQFTASMTNYTSLDSSSYTINNNAVTAVAISGFTPTGNVNITINIDSSLYGSYYHTGNMVMAAYLNVVGQSPSTYKGFYVQVPTSGIVTMSLPLLPDGNHGYDFAIFDKTQAGNDYIGATNAIAYDAFLYTGGGPASVDFNY